MKPIIEITGQIIVRNDVAYIVPIGYRTTNLKVEEQIKYSSIDYRGYGGGEFYSKKNYKIVLLELTEDETKAEEERVIKEKENGNAWFTPEPKTVREGTIL